MFMTRVASLLPAATEIIALLDYENCLVGRSHECDWPPHIASLPTLTSSNVNTCKSSLEIDRQVKASDAPSLF
ncbi:hypothetical protein N9A79_03255, partial [Pirellulales bacterium]|nr:hypothetical protein [Pirellulales bacterium]